MVKILFLCLTVINLSLLNACSSTPQNKKLNTDWIFIYYMPYDNNLSVYGDEILKMIQDSITSDKVIATVQADFANDLGMTRYIITKDALVKTQVKNEYSARTDSYKDYLRWVERTITYRKKAVIFLDHGGKLDELGLDEYPEFRFLKVDSLNSVFQQLYPDSKIDLLFLQVCAKGVIEPLFEFKDAAQFTLCSQIELGAPNYYYHALFSALSSNSALSGAEVAHLIINNERNDMYNSYTLIDNAALDTFCTRFRHLLESVIRDKKLRLMEVPRSTNYYRQNYWDLVSFIENIDAQQYKAVMKEKTELVNFIREHLIVRVALNPEVDEVKGTSGLSVYARGKDSNRNSYKNMSFNKLLPDFVQLEIEITAKESSFSK